jgi:Tfp pilus assembly protein PilF
MKNWKTTGLIASLIIIVLIPIAGIRFKSQQLKLNTISEPVFVGGKKCLECHENEFRLWETSHHAHAMAHANDTTVLGDFNNVEFRENGITHKFYKRNGKFYVFTRGKKGIMMEYEITHTFGYTPLQQYLIPFEKGKFQCLPIAWDTENKRWFDMGAMVYKDQDIPPGDWLYWTNQAQNWNGMCAECHSTNLEKNYLPEADSFHTTWSEINVSCEACHGPGSKHLEWANWPESKQLKDNNFGLVAKTSGIDNKHYVELCARCHTRRSQLGDFDHSYKDLLDFMVPSLINEDYYADGQIHNEDYVFGSFVQSKMYHNNIKCNDCHNVHSGNRHFEGNTLCFQCHKADYYGTPSHHFHKNIGEEGKGLYINGKEVPVGEGSLCVNCHMPAQLYMGIDSRNDHSIRIPRPDLSKEIGVPNACNQCHTDKSVEWSIKSVEEWYGKKTKPHYGTTLAAARNGDLNAEKKLIALVNDELSPLIIRATALEHLASYPSPEAFQTIRQCLESSESMLRHSAIISYHNNNAEEYISDLKPLLTDPVKAVRMQAGLMFSNLPKEYIPKELALIYKNALNEFQMQNEYMADFPSGRMNLGITYSNLGDNIMAIKNYERAIEIDSAFIPAFANLALAYNNVGRNKDAEYVYKALISQNTDLPGIYYSLGLLLVQEKKFDEAIHYLELAAIKDLTNSRINYNLGLLYSQLNKSDLAEKQLLTALRKQPEDFDYQYGLAHFYLNSKQYSKAESIVNKMKRDYPDDENVAQLYNYLQSVKH